MLLLSTIWISNSLINLFVFRMLVFAFVLSVLTINLLMITRHFGSDPSIFRFNVISLSTIICGVPVVALLVPAWIITVSRSSCNKSFSPIKILLRYACLNKDSGSEADSGLVKLVVMTNVFFNKQQDEIEIKRFIFLKYIKSRSFCNG